MTVVNAKINYGYVLSDEELKAEKKVGENVVFDTMVLNPALALGGGHLTLKITPQTDVEITGSEANDGKGFGVKIETSDDNTTFKTLFDESATAGEAETDLDVSAGADIMRNGDIGNGFAFPMETARHIKISIPDVETSGLETKFDIELLKFGA